VTYSFRKLPEEIDNQEFLYRGIIEVNWDFKRNRPSSATFKDSNGVSVDRDGARDEIDCVRHLIEKRDFFGVCKVKAGKVREKGALLKYLPLEDNIFHSEIHDSEERKPMRGSKPKKIRDESIVVYKS